MQNSLVLKLKKWFQKVRQYPKFNLGQLNAYKLMFLMKFSMEKQIKKIWIAGFFLPAIDATVFNDYFVNTP